MDKEEKVIVFNMFQYFDYSIFSKEDNGKLKEYMLSNVKMNWGLLPNDIETLEGTIDYIRSKVKNVCISDVVVATIYSCVVTEHTYNDMKNIYSDLSDEQLKMRLFKSLFFKSDSVMVRGSYPIILRDLSKSLNYKI